MLAAVHRLSARVRGRYGPERQICLRGASQEGSAEPPNTLKAGDRGEKSRCCPRPQRVTVLLQEKEVMGTEGLAWG